MYVNVESDQGDSVKTVECFRHVCTFKSQEDVSR